MKKILSLIIILTMLLSLIACELQREPTGDTEVSATDGIGQVTEDVKSETEEAVTELTDETDRSTNESAVKESAEDTTCAENEGAITEGDESSETRDETKAESEELTDKSDEVESETEDDYVSPYLAPDFTVYDLEGNAVKLSDFRGKPIVLNFWARDCIYCTREMPDFESMYKKYGDKVEFLMVCFTSFSNRGLEYEQEYIDDNGYTFPIYFDTENSAVSKYGINSIPQTFFINKDFDLYTYIPGMASAEALETCIGYIIE